MLLVVYIVNLKTKFLAFGINDHIISSPSRMSILISACKDLDLYELLSNTYIKGDFKGKFCNLTFCFDLVSYKNIVGRLYHNQQLRLSGKL